MRWSTLALVSLAVAGPLPAQTVTEPGSGVAFPTALAVPDGTRQMLAGTGLRTRTMLNVKVYAFGLYVDQEGARRTLGSYAGRASRDLERDPAFYDAILQMGFPMTMRLVMTRNVTGEQMAEAFDGALRPRVVAAASRSMPGGEAALGTFRGYFSVDRLTEGTELLFTCANGTLHSQVGPERRAPIESRALCWALFDVYLGRSPISGSGKRTAIALLPDLLRP